MKKVAIAVVLGITVFVLVIYVTISERNKLNDRIEELQRARNVKSSVEKFPNHFAVTVMVDSKGHVIPTGIIQ